MKRALVISGGGSKGAFAVGVLQRLKMVAPTLHFDIIAGTSTGALISPLAATEEYAELQRIYTSITTDKIVTQHRLGDRLTEKSIYTVEPLYQLLKSVLTDARYNQIVQSGKAVQLVTTCLQTGGTVVYSTVPHTSSSQFYSVKKIKDAEHMRLAVLASACQPVLMTPVKVDAAYATGAEKNYQYVDGGVREYAGIQMAIDAGATEIFAVLLSTAKDDDVTSEYTTLFPILERTISILSEDVQKNDVVGPQQTTAMLRYISQVKQKMKNDGVPQAKIDSYFTGSPLQNLSDVKLYVIRPDTSLGGGPGGLVFNPTEMQGMVDRGKGSTDNFIASLGQGDKNWLV